MTVHGAKGLEFPYVFILGTEENLFPSYKSMEGGRGRPGGRKKTFLCGNDSCNEKVVYIICSVKNAIWADEI